MKKSLFIFTIMVISLSSCNNEQGGTSNSNSTIVTKHDCPHCNGVGQRTNTLTGVYQDCSSCSGKGEVTNEQYKRLSK